MSSTTYTRVRSPAATSGTHTEAPRKEAAPASQLVLVLRKAQRLFNSDKEKVEGLRDKIEELKSQDLSPKKLKEALKALNDELDETKVKVCNGIDEIKADVNVAMPDASQFDDTEEGRQRYNESAALFLDTVTAVTSATRTWGQLFEQIVEKAKEILRAVADAVVEAAQAVAHVAKEVMKIAFKKVKDFVTWVDELLKSPGAVLALQVAVNLSQS